MCTTVPSGRVHRKLSFGTQQGLLLPRAECDAFFFSRLFFQPSLLKLFPPPLLLCPFLCVLFFPANFLGAEVLLDFLCILCALCYAWDLASSITIA